MVIDSGAAIGNNKMQDSEIIAQLCTPLTLSQGATLNPLLSGQVNHVFRLDDDTRQYIVKWLGQDDFTGLARNEQFALQLSLAEQGLAPAPIWMSDDHTLWVEEYIPDGSFDVVDMPMLASLLWTIHQTKVKAPTLDLIGAWQRYIQVSGLPPEHELCVKSRRLSTSVKRLTRDAGQVALCHNDLSFRHIMSISPIRILDWEYAAIGSRYFDIAACIQVNRLSEHQRQSLLLAYAQHSSIPLDTLVEEVNAAEPVLLHTVELWEYAAQENNRRHSASSK